MITEQEINQLVANINEILQEDRAKLKISFHFAAERLNDNRNNPPITLNELRTIFIKFIKHHLQKILEKEEGFSFTIKCKNSGIAIPCAIEHEFDIGSKWVIQQVITIMRKWNFNAYHGDALFEI